LAVTAFGLASLAAAGADAQDHGALLHAVLATSRTGVIVFSPDRRIVLRNAAFVALLDLEADALPPGTSHAEMLELLIARGEYANIDAAAHARAMLAMDGSRPNNFRRTRPNGQILESVLDPLPDGGYAIYVSDVTQLVAAEHSAAERGRLLDTVLATSRAGIAVYGPDGRLMLHNAAYEAMLDFKPGQLAPGMPVQAVMDLLRRRGEFAGEAGDAYVQSVLAIDRTRPHQRRRTRPNGQVLDFSSDPLPDGGFVLTVTDVTALAAAQEDARARASLLESVLAALPQGISLFGPDRRARLVNPAYHVIMGDAAVRPGETMAELIERRRKSGEYGPGEQGDHYADQTRQDFSRPARRRRTRPDGTTIDVRTAPLPDGGHVSVVTDVTLEVTAQAELQRRTALLDLMMAHMNHGMALFDAEERVVLFNAQAESLAGIAPGWLRPGRTRQDIIAHLRERGVYGEGPGADAQAGDYRARDPRRVQRLERSLPDGRVIEMRSDPLPGGGYVVATWDVTWRRETEAQLRAAKETAEAASRAKSSFLASISHELRTPLNAVIGFSEAIGHEADKLADADASPGRIAEYAHAVNDAGRHLLALINDILDVARIEAGRVELAESAVDVQALIDTCRRTMEPAARAARVLLEVEPPASLPRLRGDERRLRQVLLNLLSNAVKFTPAGGSVRLSVGADVDGGMVITVRDSGIGIATDDIARAFEPFTQLESDSTRRAPGSGLGLFLSRALAAAHGGTLDLESAPGEGTTAILRLPASRMLTRGSSAPAHHQQAWEPRS
jgi:signal transduction histidine kinase